MCETRAGKKQQHNHKHSPARMPAIVNCCVFARRRRKCLRVFVCVGVCALLVVRFACARVSFFSPPVHSCVGACVGAWVRACGRAGGRILLPRSASSGSEARKYAFVLRLPSTHHMKSGRFMMSRANCEECWEQARQHEGLACRWHSE